MVQVKSGIYIIQNKINHKFYIGSSINIYNRWNAHKQSLRRGDHHCTPLQSAWNKYGEHTFTFNILKEVYDISSNQHKSDEQKQLDEHYGSEMCYNTSPSASGGIIGEKNHNYSNGMCGLSPCIDCKKLKPKNNVRCVECWKKTGYKLTREQQAKHKKALQKSGQKYIYNTPQGKYLLKEAAEKYCVNVSVMRRLCEKADKILTKDAYNKSPILQKNHTPHDIGKTYRDIGWYREKMPNGISGKIHTPWGKYRNAFEAAEHSPITHISKKSQYKGIRTWCDNHNEIITNYHYGNTEYLKITHKRENVVGKTWKEIGFYNE